MEVKTKTRQSNFELMRIVSMFMIVVWHFIYNTGFMETTTGSLHFLLVFIWFIFIVHVNSFIILTGYFQCDKKIKVRKLIELNNSAWFYKVLFLIIFLVFGIVELNNVEIMKLASPITLFNQYWFLSIYILLYMLSPFLNNLVNVLTKQQYHKMLIILFIVTSILPTISGQLVYDNELGHSIISFVLLYFIGAYLKKYPLKENYYFKKLTTSSIRVMFLFLFFFLAFVNGLLYLFAEQMIVQDNSIVKEIGNIIILMRTGFDNPIVIIQSVCFFIYFSNLNIKSKVVNFISGCSFGVYLIHDNPLVRTVLYKPLIMSNFTPIVIIIIFIASIVVFLICIMIEFIRKSIFKLFRNSKIALRLRNKYQNYFKTLNLNIPW